MATPSKAKRPKRRWVGLHVFNNVGREDVISFLEEILPSSSLRLYDLHNVNEKLLGIVRVNLSEVSDFISKCEDDSRLKTMTTSGKIRLVRERLSLPLPNVRR